MVKTDNMTYEEKLEYYATAKRITVGTISQLIDGKFKKFFVGKLHGKIVSRVGDDQYKFEKVGEALACARGFRDHCKELLAGMEEVGP